MIIIIMLPSRGDKNMNNENSISGSEDDGEKNDVSQRIRPKSAKQQRNARNEQTNKQTKEQTNKQTSKQTKVTEQTNKQTNKQRNKQTNKQVNNQK